ncbi:MAG: aspartate kinase [Oscillospiraceae bacterium]
MGIIVQKFGGTSVADREKLFRAAKIITDAASAGNSVVAVVSAQGNTTDELLKKAAEIGPAPSKRELDALLATGESASSALLAMAVGELGYPAVSLAGWQMGIFTESAHGNAKILEIEAERILSELKKGNIVIAAGFQGVDAQNDVTTLGRGGSDTTAVALAAALHADACRVYKDVDGIYSADPRLEHGARKYDIIGYDEMLTLAQNGAQVLHVPCIELAKKSGVVIEVLSTFEDKPGTVVK